MKKLILILVSFTVVIAGIITFRTKTDRTTIINYTPFKQSVSVGYGISEGTAYIQAQFHLEPGERKEVTGKYRFDRKSFYIFSQTVDTALVNYVYDGAQTVYFEGDVDRVYFNPHIHGAQQPNDTINYGSEDLYGYQGFDSAVKKNQYLIFDSLFAQFLMTPEDEVELLKGDYASNAVVLSKALRLQADFGKRFSNPMEEFPFHLGVSLQDSNSAFAPGVTVSEKLSDRYPDNGLVPLMVDDIIIGFDDNVVFGNTDLFSLLYLHGYSLSKGIEKPFSLTIIRDGSIHSVESSYFFNPYYYGDTENGSIAAVFEGIKDTIFYGKSPEVSTILECGFTAVKDWLGGEKLMFDSEKYAINRWKRAQRRHRLKQFNQRSFTWAGIASMFFSPAQGLTKVVGKKIAKTGMGVAASRQTASIAIEIGEESLWLYNTESVVSSGQTFSQKLKQDIPMVMSIGIVTGSINRFKI